MQKGTTLIEVILSLLILSTCMLGSGLFVLKSIRLSKLAFAHTQIVLCVENLATLYALYHTTGAEHSPSFQQELALAQLQFKEALPMGDMKIQIMQNELRCSFSWKEEGAQQSFQKYNNFKIDKDGQIIFS